MSNPICSFLLLFWPRGFIFIMGDCSVMRGLMGALNNVEFGEWRVEFTFDKHVQCVNKRCVKLNNNTTPHAAPVQYANA